MSDEAHMFKFTRIYGVVHFGWKNDIDTKNIEVNIYSSQFNCTRGEN